MDHAHPVASVPMRQRSDLLAQLNVGVGPSLIAQRSALALIRTTVSARRSLNPFSTMLRTSSLRAGTVTTMC